MDTLAIDEVNAAVGRDLMTLAVGSEDEEVVVNGIGDGLGILVPILVACIWGKVGFPNDLLLHPVNKGLFPASVNENIGFLGVGE